ncbi:increased recombination centers protein 6 [Scheffersomyces amazonensis]|uniref:increased recombination centers protein 6 n=1 Tax=Scheffersomyces amazonensis TaxID=1078765 RepID=UPI00315CB7D1
MIPNHILILGAPHSGKLRISKTLCDDVYDQIVDDDKIQSSHSGIIIKSKVSTKYYSVNLNILVDEYPEIRNEQEEEYSVEHKLRSLKKWKDEFLSDECSELRDVLDGFIYCISLDDNTINDISDSIEIINEIRNGIVGDRDWNGFIAIVGTSTKDKNDLNEDVEDLVILNGYEYIDFDKSGRNEYHETVGKDRIVEIVQSNEWTHMETKENVNYDNNKKKKMYEMTRGLLSSEGEEREEEEEVNSKLDLDEIFAKLKLAKDEKRKSM